MKKWTYKSVKIHDREDLLESDIIEFMDAFGAEGWEIFQVEKEYFIPPNQHRYHVILWMKRPY